MCNETLQCGLKGFEQYSEERERKCVGNVLGSAVLGICIVIDSVVD